MILACLKKTNYQASYSQSRLLTIIADGKTLVQWQAWLRHTRYEAPTIEELLKEQRRRQLLQQRVRQLQLEEQEEKVIFNLSISKHSNSYTNL